MDLDQEMQRFPISTPPKAGETIEVAPGILWARMPLPYRLDHVNVYFIADDGGWAILDTGLAEDGCRDSWEALLAGPLADASFTKLIVTHAHPDHIGLAGWLCERLNIPLLTSLGSYLGCLKISLDPGAMEQQIYQEFYRAHGMAEDVAAAVRTLGHGYLRLVTPLPKTFQRIMHGDSIMIGGRSFEVLTGEGHAHEQVMLYCRDEKLFLAADEVLTKITPNVSVWAVEPQGNPLNLYMRSLRMIVREIDEGALVLPGHHLPFYGLHQRCQELVAHHRERCDRIVGACRENAQSVADLVPPLFPHIQDVHQLGFAFNEVHAHVNYLVNLGELEQSDMNGIQKAISRS